MSQWRVIDHWNERSKHLVLPAPGSQRLWNQGTKARCRYFNGATDLQAAVTSYTNPYGDSARASRPPDRRGVESLGSDLHFKAPCASHCPLTCWPSLGLVVRSYTASHPTLTPRSQPRRSPGALAAGLPPIRQQQVLGGVVVHQHPAILQVRGQRAQGLKTAKAPVSNTQGLAKLSLNG